MILKNNFFLLIFFSFSFSLIQGNEKILQENNLKFLSLEEIDSSEVTKMVLIEGGKYYMGSQFFLSGAKIAPAKVLDGAKPRRKVQLKSFYLDEHVVTNKQFAKFVKDNEYVTEAEKFGWSFVLENFVSPTTLAEVESKEGLGRVKDAPHWLGVKGASWGRPFGPDSTFAYFGEYPAVHISYNDAVDYCTHYGKRLPSEKEWEYAARNGYENATYPWGNDTYIDNQFNLWQGKFPKQNTKQDGYTGVAPAISYSPNSYGVYNLLGNVWEWVSGGTTDKRILRGGSFLDSKDGSFNHIVAVSTKQINGGDSGANNIGFRCAKSLKENESKSSTNKDNKENEQEKQQKREKEREKEEDRIEL